MSFLMMYFGSELVLIIVQVVETSTWQQIVGNLLNLSYFEIDYLDMNEMGVITEIFWLKIIKRITSAHACINFCLANINNLHRNFCIYASLYAVNMLIN